MELNPRIFGLSRPQIDNCVFTENKISVPHEINAYALKELYIDAPYREGEPLSESERLSVQMATALHLALTHKSSTAQGGLASINSLLRRPAT